MLRGDSVPTLSLRSLPMACLQQAGRDDKVPLYNNTRRPPTLQTLSLSHGGLEKYRDLTGFENLLGLYRNKLPNTLYRCKVLSFGAIEFRLCHLY